MQKRIFNLNGANYIQTRSVIFNDANIVPCSLCDFYKNNGNVCVNLYTRIDLCGPTIYLKELKEGL